MRRLIFFIIVGVLAVMVIFLAVAFYLFRPTHGEIFSSNG